MPEQAAAAPGGLWSPLPINNWESIPVETDLFSGKVLVFLRGLPNTPNAQLFTGKKRASWVAMQGRFKVPLPVDDVVTGQEFARTFKRLPAPWFVEKVLLSMARQISPSMRVGPLSAPHMLVPILASAQLVNVSEPGCQPLPMDATEDVRAFWPQLRTPSGGPVSSDARRRFFSSGRNREGLLYDTRRIYTFHFWQQFVDLATYQLDFAYSYDLARHLDGQPLQIMAKDVASGKYLYNLSVWHERLLPPAPAPAGACSAASTAAAAAGDTDAAACSGASATDSGPPSPTRPLSARRAPSGGRLVRVASALACVGLGHESDDDVEGIEDGCASYGPYQRESTASMVCK